jgi:superoxide dismutase
VNEDKQLKARTDGAQAKSLIENEMLQAAFETIKRTYTEKLFETTEDQTAAREKLYIAVRIVDHVQHNLRTVLDSGKIAEADLNRLIATANAKPKWENVTH